jgi:deazaflavin-dependent oxidoreductase (nitroreductase family)
MPTDQKVEQAWETPSLDEITELTKMHVGAMEQTDDDMVWDQAGMKHVLLTTIGRKSAKVHKVALPTWNDPEGNRIVVASFAGAPGHPAWYLNLADRTANPDVRVRVQGGEYVCVPEILDGEEYDRIWALLVDDRAWYTTYQSKTERRIPLVRLADPRDR